MAPGRDEAGFTLVELLLAMTISLVILGAALTSFNVFYADAREQEGRYETAETARSALDRQARQLRNVAKRLNNSPVIERVGDYDIIFQTSDPARTWVRYCLDTTTAPASQSSGRLWETALSLPVASETSAVTPGMSSACPGSGWSRTTIVADNITNRINGSNRPVFSYRCSDGTDTCRTSAATFDRILQISAQTIVDTTPAAGPPELKVASGVHLRNQNQAPVASLAVTPTMSRTLSLNGSGSTDYEGRTLSMYWFKGTAPTAIRCDQPTVTLNASNQRMQWGSLVIGEGITLSYTFPTIDGSTSQTITLVVCDPGDRYGTASATVGIPT